MHPHDIAHNASDLKHAFLVLMLFTVAPLCLHAQFTWTGGGTSGVINDPLNWAGNNRPLGDGLHGNENVSFGDANGAAQTVNVPSSGFVLNDLAFDGAARPTYTFIGTDSALFAITGDLTANNGGSITISSSLGITLSGDGTDNLHTFNVSSNIVATISAAIGEAGSTASLTKSGAGNLSLNGLNTYTGGTAINEGVLIVNSLANGGVASNLGASSSAAGNLVIDHGTLRIDGPGYISTDRMFTIGTNGATIDAAGQAPISFMNSSAIAFAGSTSARALTLIASNTIYTSSEHYFHPSINDNHTGATSLVKSGPGTWVLAGNNTYTGGTTINEGALKIYGNGALPFGGNVIINGLATTGLVSQLSLPFGFENTIGSLTFRGVQNAPSTVALGNLSKLTLTGAVIYDPTNNPGTASITGGTLIMGANQIFDVGDSTARSVDLRVTSFISGTTSTLTKNGLGTLQLSGSSNYIGPTNVNAGTLMIIGSIESSSTTSVASGAKLMGNGRIGALALSSGSFLAPGQQAPGTLAVGSTTIAGGATYLWETSDAAGLAGTNWDLLSISGTLLFNADSQNKITLHLATSGASTGLAANFDPTKNYSFTIATATNILGFNQDFFAIDTANFQNPLSEGKFTLSATTTTLTLNFIPIPEPSTCGLIILGLSVITMGVWWRRVNLS